MTLDEYQEKAHESSMDVSIGGNRALYPILGLAGEIGELQNKIKKVFRDGIVLDDRELS